MNLLEQAQYEYLRGELKKVIKDFQGIIEYHTNKNNEEQAKTAERNQQRIANFAGFCESILVKKMDITTPVDEDLSTDKEGLRLQSILQLERDMPHLFQPYKNAKDYVISQ